MSPLIVLSSELRVAGLRHRTQQLFPRNSTEEQKIPAMFKETKMFLFVGALILYIETVTSCGESGRLIICKYLGKVSKMQ